MTVGHVYTSCKTEETRASKYDVNVRMVAFICILGKGYEALRHFSTYLNSPHPMNKMSYQKCLEDHHTASKKVAVDSMKCAAAKVKESVGGDCTMLATTVLSLPYRLTPANGWTRKCSQTLSWLHPMTEGGRAV